MKTKIFFTLFLFFVTTCGFSYAQQEYDDAPWCPAGATWTYERFSNPYTYSFLKLVYEKDSSVQGKNVKTIGVHFAGWSFDYNGAEIYWKRSSRKVTEEYLYEQNDSIFRYDKLDDRFVFLYSWNFKIGDTFVGRNMTAITMRVVGEGEYPVDLPSDTFVVSSVTDISYIGGKLFRLFSARSLGGIMRMTPIISKIGAFSNPFPFPYYESKQYFINSYQKTVLSEGDTLFEVKEYGYSYTYESGLVCYSDSIRGHYVMNNSFVEDEIPYCLNADTLIVVGNENAAARKQNASLYKLYPNPVYDEVCISAEENTVIKRINILTAMGEQITSIVGNKQCVPTSALPSGVYLMRIMDDKGRWETLKFVKAK
ncbi:MAG: T9SS type A sorting domain-containing protein [Bacteroidales bacterium]|jgi:hypothetical protein|nr:T9SS type A sorting domain-containing protein [Bacteroidales bacterium]